MLYVVWVVTVSDAEFESAHEELETVLHVAPFLVMVQAFAPAVIHDTLIVPPILTRFGEALIEAETVGSEELLAEQVVEAPVQLLVLIVPALVCPQELGAEVQEEEVMVQTGAGCVEQAIGSILPLRQYIEP